MKVTFDGVTYDFPDDTSDAEVLDFINRASQQPQQSWHTRERAC